MKRLFKWLLFTVLVLAAGIALVLYNPNLVKQPLERHLSKMTGYGLSLEGELNLAIGRSIEISVSGLRIAAPDWSGEEDLATIDDLRLKLDSASLLSDIPVVEELRAQAVRLNLEVDAEGNGNWVPQRSTGPADEQAAGSQVLFYDVLLDDATLVYANARRDVRHVLHVASFSQRQLSDGMLEVVLEGDFNGRPVNFSGVAGPYANLLEGRQVSYQVQGNFGSIDIRGEGLIDDLADPGRPEFDLVMQGPDIDEITAMLGADDLGAGVFSLHALGSVVGERYEAGINGDIGDVSLSLSVTADDLSSLGEFDLELAANGPNLGALTRVFGIENWPDKPFSIKGSAQRSGRTLNVSALSLNIGGSRMVLDALFNNFPTFDASRVKLNVSGDDITQFKELLGIRGVASGPFELNGRLDVSPGEVELLQLDVTTSLGRMTLNGTLGNAPGYDGSRVHLHLEGQNANGLMNALGIDALPAEPFSLDARVLKTENGLVFERGVLVTVANERLELDGFVSLQPGGEDTDIRLTVYGQHLGRVLGRALSNLEFADIPYRLNGRVRVADEAVVFDGFEAAFADVVINVDGSVNLTDEPVSDDFEFRWRGENFTAIGDFVKLDFSLEAFVPGQPYQAHGVFSIVEQGWRLNDVEGRIGDTDVAFSGLISNQADYVGTNFEFSLAGPDLHTLVIDRDLSDVPIGAFETSGNVGFGGNRLHIQNFRFETGALNAGLELEMGLPVVDETNIRFDLSLRGDDIRHLVPKDSRFEPSRAGYRIEAVGNKRGQSLSLRRFDLDVGALDVSLEGDLDGSGGAGANVRFSAVSDDLSALGTFNDAGLPVLALDLRAKLVGSASRFAVRDIEGLLGESDFAGSVTADLDQPKPVFTLDLRSRLLDLRPFLGDGAPDEPVDPVTPDGRMIPDMPLPLDLLDTADISVALAVDELRTKTNSLRDIVLQGEVASGSLRLPKLSWTGVHGGQQRGSFSVVPVAGGPAKVRLDIDAHDLIFGYTGLTKGLLHSTPKMDLSIHADGSGNDLRTLAGSMNGELFVISAGGVLPDVQLSLLDTFILDEIFKLVFAKRDDLDDDLTLTCFAAVFDVVDGLVTTEPAIAFATDKIRLVAKGSLDLKTEALHFNFTATPRNVLKVSASELLNPYILVSGTLSDPKVGIDPARALIHGGAAVGTSGISILAKAVLDRMGATAPLCEKILEEHQGN